MPETPSTELDAVNVILTNMGEAPLNSLDGDLPLDALKAQNVLQEFSRETQTRGWFWNKETTTFSPNVDNKIPLPSNALAVRNTTKAFYLTERDGFLYRIEKNNNGDIFTDATEMEVTYFLPFEQLPEVARRAITMKAARIFQGRELGNQALIQQDSQEELAAFATMRAEDNENSRRNLQQSLSTRMITDRYNSLSGSFR